MTQKCRNFYWLENRILNNLTDFDLKNFWNKLKENVKFDFENDLWKNL